MAHTATAQTVPQQAAVPKLEVTSITVITCTANTAHNHATIKARLGDTPPQTFEGVGTGPIDAMCKAFDHFEPGFVVDNWSGKSAGSGSAAEAVVDVMVLCADGKTYHGNGRHANTMQATAIAIAEALNKHFYVQHLRESRQR